MICAWCREVLFWVDGKGWVHSDGELYKTFRGEDGELRDDHISRPVPDWDIVRPVRPAPRREKR